MNDAQLLQIALATLADIASLPGMSQATMKSEAARIYLEITAALAERKS